MKDPGVNECRTMAGSFPFLGTFIDYKLRLTLWPFLFRSSYRSLGTVRAERGCENKYTFRSAGVRSV